MKANPGGPVTGNAIIGREKEISQIWRTLQIRSVLLASERRVGKTCVLRKMADHPVDGWTPVQAFVESARHPIECVEKIYTEANQMEVRSSRGVWLGRIKSALQSMAGSEIAGLKFPPIQKNWKQLLDALAEDIAENMDKRVLIMVDEFPLMVNNVIEDHGPGVGMEVLDSLREIRQKYEPSGRVRFVLSGSIGLNLVLQHLRREHGYKGAPTNDMAQEVLSGMTIDDTELMCQRLLDEEGVRRMGPAEVRQRMFEATDGLPHFIQHVCEQIQRSGVGHVTPEDIDRIVRELLDDPAVQGFRDAADRIETYYKRLHVNEVAFHILKMLCYEEDLVREEDILDYVRSQMVVGQDRLILSTLEWLRDDHYIIRDTATGERRYRFRYRIMRQWWQINQG